MDGGEVVIVAGVGFSSTCDGEELTALVRRAQAAASCEVERLAAPAWKGHAPCLATVAASLGLTIIAVERARLAEVADRVATHSPVSRAFTALGSVAEAAALAAAGAGSRLVLARISSAHATCALAEGNLS